MKKKWHSWIPLILVGSIFFYSLLWYGISLFFEKEMQRFAEDLKAKGVSLSLSSYSFAGYPLKFRAFLHHAKLEWNEEIAVSVPSLSIESNFLFPLTRAIEIRFEDVGKILLNQKQYTLNLSDLEGTLRLSPGSLEVKASSVTLWKRKNLFGELKEAKLLLMRQPEDQIKTNFQGDLKLYFTNVITPTLDIEMNIQFLLHHWETFLHLGRSEKHSHLPIHLQLDLFDLKMVGSTFKGSGSLTKKPEDSWEGNIDLKLQGLPDFVDLMEDFFQRQRSPLLQILNQLPQFFQNNESGEISLPLRLQKERLSIRGFPFLSFPLN